jgi:hypothetical protein
LELFGLLFGLAVVLLMVTIGLLVAGCRHAQQRLQRAMEDAQTQKAAAESALSAVTTQRDQLHQRLKPVLEIEAERLRLAAALAEDRSQLELELRWGRAKADVYRRTLESEIAAGRAAAAEEIAKAEEESRRGIGVVRIQVEAELAALCAQRDQTRQEIQGLEGRVSALRSAILSLEETANIVYMQGFEAGTRHAMAIRQSALAETSSEPNEHQLQRMTHERDQQESP